MCTQRPHAKGKAAKMGTKTETKNPERDSLRPSGGKKCNNVTHKSPEGLLAPAPATHQILHDSGSDRKIQLTVTGTEGVSFFRGSLGKAGL